jgi:FMN phosphatase YigB (HAD superfamily)
MKRFRAVFFDRDGTLSRLSPARLGALSRAFARAMWGRRTGHYVVRLYCRIRADPGPPAIHARDDA